VEWAQQPRRAVSACEKFRSLSAWPPAAEILREPPRKLPFVDQIFAAADSALRTLFAKPCAARACPVLPADETRLEPHERRHSAALMRVNHVGEVCAQALYTAQALTTRDAALRRHFEQASAEETDHLAWTAERIHELGARTSLLNPLWYAGAFGIGLIAGRFGDRVSLGFVVETERQVESHLQRHLERLPAGDHASRAIVVQMKEDEAVHAASAQAAGGVELPAPVRGLMRAAAKVMTTTAHYV
jgi:3-demethoxyubiquinol 3-hydroxylase